MNNVKTAALLGFLGALFVGLGYLLGGVQGGFVALGFAALFNFGMYFFSDRLALRASRARPLDPTEMPNVHSIVSSLAQREQMPMPALYVIDSPQPNAFATGRSPRHAAVAVTTGIVEILDIRELEGVLAHELAHVKNRDILISTIAATLAAALAFLARMALWSNLGGRRDNPVAGIIGLVSLIVAPLAAALIQMAISRSREFEADRDGAAATGSPLALASALDKISAGTARHPMEVNPAVSQLFIADPLKAFGSRRGRQGQFSKMFSTHPPIHERIDRLHRMASGIS